MSVALSEFLEILASFAIALAVIPAGLAVERQKTLSRLNSRAALFNILYFVPASILRKMLAPAGAAVSCFVIGRHNLLGGRTGVQGKPACRLAWPVTRLATDSAVGATRRSSS
jgi:hypothetical protein